MLRRPRSAGFTWLPATIFGATVVLGSAAGFCGQIAYRTYLTASMNVTAGPGHLSVARYAGGDGSLPSNAVTINSQGSSPYVLFFGNGLVAPAPQPNVRAMAAYKLCGDPACSMVWAPNGDPTTGLVVTPGSASSAQPLTVIRTATTDDDDSASDVVTLTMYF